ncbi:zwei Ig domain protein zig-2-like isoform X2 [Artemia franciscana]|uniref:Ig-like domain-containing protein n=1 Tax=Artemia franciscana TaxID=6661 RepID=A0AA88HIV2_ARTSF|nr:hypothetical protein QYM36_015963 [Artemia franciscana]
MSRKYCFPLFALLLSLFSSSVFPRSISSRKLADYRDQKGYARLEELLARKQRSGLTSEERDKDGENILKRNGFIKIHNKPKYRHVLRRNGSLVLECDVSGQPPPSVYWLKNGEPPISQEESDNEIATNQINQYEYLTSGDGLASTRSRFFIDCATSDDEAIYSCVAEIPKDRTVSSTYVRITGPGPDPKKCKPDCVKPRIHMWSGTYVHESGKDARLVCRATGPDVEIQWFDEDDEPLLDQPLSEPLSIYTNKYIQLDSGDLIVKNLEWSDMGGYYCRARNECGEDKEFTFLYPVAPES